MRFTVFACVVVAGCLGATAPAFALDDLGVVSGETFGLPGYNDGPSGGGVWPGSSGKGGDVGAMPLPNGVPAGGDIGGGPGSGPTGGDGPGTDGAPKVDQTRPPYRQPRERNTVQSKQPFAATVDPCESTSSTGVSKPFAGRLILPLQGVRDGDGAPVYRQLQGLLLSEIRSLDAAIKRLLEVGRIYSKAKAADSPPDKLREIAEELAMRAFEAGKSALKVSDLLSDYIKVAFAYRSGPKSVSECAEDASDRLARAELAVALAQLAVDATDASRAVPAAIDALNSFGFLDGIAWLHAFKDSAIKITTGVANFGIGFFKAFFSSWRDFYSDEIRQLKGRSGSPGR